MPDSYFSHSYTINNIKETTVRYNTGSVYTEDSTYEYSSGKVQHTINTIDKDTGITRDLKEIYSNGNLIELLDITYDDSQIYNYKMEKYSEIFPDVLIENKFFSEDNNGFYYLDSNADGLAEMYTQFDENHRPKTSWLDNNSDGDIDYIYHYDEFGYAIPEDHRSLWEKIFGLKY